ncbi:hypothetical protein WDU94_013197 [Cyamophila willieti]
MKFNVVIRVVLYVIFINDRTRVLANINRKPREDSRLSISNNVDEIMSVKDQNMNRFKRQVEGNIIDKLSQEDYSQMNTDDHDSEKSILNKETKSLSFETDNGKKTPTPRSTREFVNKQDILGHFSILLSKEYITPRQFKTFTYTEPPKLMETKQRTDENDGLQIRDKENLTGKVAESPTPFIFTEFNQEGKLVEFPNPQTSPPTTHRITCLPYLPGEDLFEYYLRNVSQGITTEMILTRKRIRLRRTTTPRQINFGYDSATSVPGYFDDSLGKLVDDYVGSESRPNTSEIMRVRARDATLLKEWQEKRERKQVKDKEMLRRVNEMYPWNVSAAESEEGWDNSVWRDCPIITSIPPRTRSTLPPPTSTATDDMFDYVIKHKRRRRVNPAEPILRTLITKEPYEMFERLFGTKVTKILPITFP